MSASWPGVANSSGRAEVRSRARDHRRHSDRRGIETEGNGTEPLASERHRRFQPVRVAGEVSGIETSQFAKSGSEIYAKT